MEIKNLIHPENLPCRLFYLHEHRFREVLERLRMTGFIHIESFADLGQITFTKTTDYLECLEMYFQKRDLYADESDYFDAYTYLQAAIKRNIDKRVILRTLPLKTWLVKGLKKYRRAESEKKRSPLVIFWPINGKSNGISLFQMMK